MRPGPYRELIRSFEYDTFVRPFYILYKKLVVDIQVDILVDILKKYARDILMDIPSVVRDY